ncbi:nuclear transport factor 2 family protein (plasmid) [Shinella sp. H4-D48]|uniref:nuclear transport factor 2 family protein n=1 Tax=Shinella sp. H4-D48 TaxID=2925841 RepID=UPI001F53653B|nr:nuclear transport factor 2 family protein [Shinella sp. H4-D48]UNK40936.1 nuclear transport factor 2 family protein [Shinella sp. H4-D48]
MHYRDRHQAVRIRDAARVRSMADAHFGCRSTVISLQAQSFFPLLQDHALGTRNSTEEATRNDFSQESPKGEPMTETFDKARLADILEIKALNAKYNYAVDDADGEKWASCFTKTGVFNALIEGQRPCGPQELAAFVGLCNETFGMMHHLTTNEIISFDGATARQKVYLQFFAVKDGKTEGSICVYQDWLEQVDGAWKYSRRDVEYKVKFTEFAQPT